MKFARLLLRLWVGGTFAASSLYKIRFPVVFAAAVQSYDLLSPRVIPLAALVVPWMELLAGSCLLLGLQSRAASLVSGALSLLFSVIVAVTLARGLDISCGCFTNQSMARVSGGHLVFDLLLVAAAVLLYRQGPGPLALDRVVLGARQSSTPA